jgi:RHS repeat-associated protein
MQVENEVTLQRWSGSGDLRSGCGAGQETSRQQSGHVISETTQGCTTRWTYNNTDQPLTMTYPDNEVVTTHYNPLMQLDSLTGTNAYVQSATYDLAGRLTDLVLGDLVNGAGKLDISTPYYPWNQQGGRLHTITTLQNGNSTPIQALAYGYDNAGNITTIADALLGPQTQTFTYDSLNRLSTAQATGGSHGLYNETYNFYDTPGNNYTGNLENKGDTTLQYTDSSHVHAVTSAGNNSYQYDANGNMKERVIGDQHTALEYDAENRLVKVCQDTNGNAACNEGETIVASFVYDGDGNRVQSTMSSITTTFIGNYYEYNSSTHEITKYYYAGAQRVAMRKYIIPQTQTLSFLLSDHLGSTSLTTDSSGNPVSQLWYKPWGEVRYSTSTNSSLETGYTFTGQYSDSYINLLWYGSREYDPAIGRFISPDSIVPDGPQGYDRYAYVNNDPVNHTDPTGHDPFWLGMVSPIFDVAAVVAVVLTETAQPVGDNASNIWELVKLGVEQADHAYITGDGLKNLEDDPSVQAKENKIADDITGDPRYGKQAFSIQGDYTDPKEPSFTADGPSRNFAIGFLTGNQGFLMVHSATLYATDTQVSENGTISTTWKVEDQFDYLPDWQNHARPHYWEYNLTAQFVVAPIYYGWLNAKAQVPDTAEWHQTIPSHDWWDDSCSRCE